jgi:hypothetical protein
MTPDRLRAVSINPAVLVSPTPHSRSVSMGARHPLAGVEKLVSAPPVINPPPAHAATPDRSSPSATVLPAAQRDTPDRGGKRLSILPVPALAISSPAKTPPAPPKNSNYAATQTTPTPSRRVTANSGPISVKKKSNRPNVAPTHPSASSITPKGGSPPTNSPQSSVMSPGSSDTTLSLTNGASGLTNPFVATTTGAVSKLESLKDRLPSEAWGMQNFPIYGGHIGEVSFGSGTGERAGTSDDSTELDMITDDGEVDEEVSTQFAGADNLAS